MKGAAYARWSGRAEAGGESCVCDFGIEVVGVEVFTQPLTSLGVLGMNWIGEILLKEGLRWRRQETWFGERVDPEFAEKRGGSRHSAPHHPRAA